MSHKITLYYLQCALDAIENVPYNVRYDDPLIRAERAVDAMQQIAHDALNGEWDTQLSAQEPGAPRRLK